MNSSLHPRIDTALPAGLPVGMWFANRSRRGRRERPPPVRRLRARTTGIGMVLVLAALTASADTVDDYLWEVNRGCKTITGTENYLARYPQGKHAEEAYGCLERMREELAAWEQARSCRDRKNVEWYLKRYPGGQYRDEAKACLEKLAPPTPGPVREPAPSPIEVLLALCEQHFEANRLTTGVGGTAVECYLEVLARDPSNLGAIAGLQRVFEKYEAWARRALQKEDLAKARGDVDKMRGLVPEAPAVRELDEAIAHLERQREDEARIAAEEEAKQRADEAHVAEEEAKQRADEAHVAAEEEAKRRIEEAENQETPAAQERFRDCQGCPQIVVVPSGEYMMGTENYDYVLDDEEPQHLVTIARPFAVGVYEVTAAEWDACVSGGGCEWNSPWGRGGGGDDPAVHVSWEDAQDYLWWLSRESEKDYRLLSESEWEYVARAGTTTAYHFGSYISRDQANFGFNWGDPDPVGSYPANEFGLHDVHGNVWEWVEDCWHDNYRGAPADGSAWTESDCGRRVLRGGSWFVGAAFLRSANRYKRDHEVRDNAIGFRVARDCAAGYPTSDC